MLEEVYTEDLEPPHVRFTVEAAELFVFVQEPLSFFSRYAMFLNCSRRHFLAITLPRLAATFFFK